MIRKSQFIDYYAIRVTVSVPEETKKPITLMVSQSDSSSSV